MSTAKFMLRLSNATRPLANTSRSGATSRCSAAASAICFFSFSAATIAALPIITVTRLE